VAWIIATVGVAALGIGFWLGQVWLIWSMSSRVLLPVSKKAPMIVGHRDDTLIATDATERPPVGGKVVTPGSEKIKDEKNGSWS
jgi:hypothetical protein